MIIVQSPDKGFRCRMTTSVPNQQVMLDPEVRKSWLQKAVSLASAYTSGAHVSAERMEARFALCQACEYFGKTRGTDGCKICGCRLGPNDKTLPNLVSFEETASYGCYYWAEKKRNKHLSVEQRSKWKQNGV